jgi:membrane fusion protein, multidrug efflux system
MIGTVGRCILLAAIGGVATSCSKNDAGSGQARPPAPVIVSSAERKSVPIEIEAIGTVDAQSTVWVKSRVDGQIDTVHFAEGDDVKKGDLLFKIDRRPFEAALHAAEAALARDKARAQNARIQVQRNSSLFEQKVISQDQLDQLRTTAEAAEAQVAEDTAACERARLDLEYCDITASADGRAGAVHVYAGNTVKANESPPLVTIHQVQPIRVIFSVPERHLVAIRSRLSEGTVRVRAVVRGAEDRAESGTLTFVDNAVDATTGTIALKATFENESRSLWPGQFVEVVVELSTRSAIVVPDAAIQMGQSGPYVFVVRKDGTADLRTVKVGGSGHGETVVESGLDAGEKVVVDGQLGLVAGARVAPREPSATSGSAAHP